MLRNVRSKIGPADFTVLTTRRRDGSLLNAWPIGSIAITVPLHCQPIHEVRIDAELVAALVAHRTDCGDAVLSRWQNAISCFNQANTDSDTFRYQTEWVLLCSAFEHLLDARPKAVDVATRRSRVPVSGKETLARNAMRRRPNWKDGDRPVRDEWMQEFYRVRGDSAHGQLNTRQPMSWTASKHLLLASIAFPLLVRALLADHGVYQFSREDQVQSNAFESLADTPDFLIVPADQQGGLESIWKRLQQRELRGLRVAAAVRAHEELERDDVIN